MKGCPGIICCRDLYPLEPKYWCEDCVSDFFSEQEYKNEGDR